MRKQEFSPSFGNFNQREHLKEIQTRANRHQHTMKSRLMLLPKITLSFHSLFYGKLLKTRQRRTDYIIAGNFSYLRTIFRINSCIIDIR